MSFLATVPVVKLEEAEVKFKLGEQPSSLPNDIEEDVYEDTGDLEFEGNTGPIFLTRLPKFVWQTWADMKNEQEIQLGTIRVEGSLKAPKRLSLLLHDQAVNAMLPKEYNMQLTNQPSSNIFLFTERDLPGYSSRSKAKSEGGSMPYAHVAPRMQFQDRPKGGFRVDKRRGSQRRGIPKKTSLVGQVQTEVNCLPVENEAYRQVMNARDRKEAKPKREIQRVQGLPVINPLDPSSLGGSSGFKEFIKTTSATKGKGREFKAARMPQNELLDLIIQGFSRYPFWSLKALKHEYKQPEAYLKETIEKVAVLVRQGPHAMTWQLKEDLRQDRYASQTQEEAPDVGGLGLDGSEEESDEGIKSEVQEG